MTAASNSERDFPLTYAVGDVHGHLGYLNCLVRQCQADAAQRGCEAPLYVFLGDYIDRGPDSAGVIGFLRAFGQTQRIMPLLGNHDQMMIDTVLNSDDALNWAFNGMASTARSYGHGNLLDQGAPGIEKLATIVDALRSDERMVDDAHWLSRLPLSYHDGFRYFVHAGVRPRVALDQQAAVDQLWIRETFLRHRGSFGRLVVHGHTPTGDGRPDQRSNRVGLDTGAYRSGTLTAGVFNDQQATPIAFLQTTGDDHGAQPDLHARRNRC